MQETYHLEGWIFFMLPEVYVHIYMSTCYLLHKRELPVLWSGSDVNYGYSLRPHIKRLWKSIDEGTSWILILKIFTYFQIVNLHNSEYWRRLSLGTWKNMHDPSSSVWITCAAVFSSFTAFGNCFNSEEKKYRNREWYDNIQRIPISGTNFLLSDLVIDLRDL